MGVVVAVIAVVFHAIVETSRSVIEKDFWHVYLNIAQTICIPFIIPELWFPALIVATALQTTRMGPQYSIREIAPLVSVLVGFSVSSSQTELKYWGSALIAFLMINLAIFFYTASDRSNQLQTERINERMIRIAKMFFWRVDLRTGLIIDVSGDTQGVMGWSNQDMIGTDAALYFTNSNDAERLLGVKEGEEDEMVVRMRHKYGAEVPIHHLVNTVGGVLEGAASDVTELTRATDTIKYQAEHDGLTDLYNRSVLVTSLDDALEASLEFGKPVALLMLDLDRFKEVNDTLGHAFGDELLRTIAWRFTSEIDVDLVARVGGDEFAFLVTGETANEAALFELGEQIVSAVKRRIEIGTVGISVGASIGIGIATGQMSPSELMQRSDLAMYQAKRDGENVALYTETTQGDNVELFALATELDDAIASGQFKLWLQPKVDSRTGALVGAEALARWHHPQLGVLTPDKFLHLLDISDAYYRFTDHVLVEGLRIAHRFNQLYPGFVVAINMSARSFFDHTLPSRVADLIQQHHVAPGALTIEVTEGDVVADHASVSDSFREMIGHGVGISIDDFGTGYSSLERLRALPVTEVKIDQSFVGDVVEDMQDRIIVRSIIELASLLGIKCVAEGVETTLVANVLSELGCDVMQGWLFGKAMPEDELYEMMANPQPNPWAKYFSPSLG